MSEFTDNITALRTAFADILRDVMTSRDKRIEELNQEIGRLKQQLHDKSKEE